MVRLGTTQYSSLGRQVYYMSKDAHMYSGCICKRLMCLSLIQEENSRWWCKSVLGL